MHTGHYISGAGHIALIGWLVFGDVFAAEPLPFETTSVSVVSSAEFAAMSTVGQSPESTTEVAQPFSPELTADAPEIAATDDATTVQTPPEQAEEPEAEEAPDVSQLAPPQADVSDQAPVLPEPPADIEVAVPQVSDAPVPQAVERVAPEAIAQPVPEALPDPIQQDAVAPDVAGETPQETAEATAPEAAATQIVTEAETPSRRITTSLRPPARPPAPRAEETPIETAQSEEVVEPDAPDEQTPVDEANDVDDTSDAVALALAEALASGSSKPAAPRGPPLTSGEKESLRVAVSRCWNVGSLSTDALTTTVVVSLAMTQDGKPVSSSIRMASSSGGSEQAARQAFEAARRAIIRCGAKGFDLPVEKYSQWQDIEMTFNPERMRIK
ncbi:energy transducer TonB [Roseobacter sp.]|uniref:energy transducer TonB n=1 Tax=Roseobacter sp. TaxID=1907202 RepID=UPI00385B580C